MRIPAPTIKGTSFANGTKPAAVSKRRAGPSARAAVGASRSAITSAKEPGSARALISGSSLVDFNCTTRAYLRRSATAAQGGGVGVAQCPSMQSAVVSQQSLAAAQYSYSCEQPP